MNLSPSKSSLFAAAAGRGAHGRDHTHTRAQPFHSPESRPPASGATASERTSFLEEQSETQCCTSTAWRA